MLDAMQAWKKTRKPCGRRETKPRDAACHLTRLLYSTWNLGLIHWSRSVFLRHPVAENYSLVINVIILKKIQNYRVHQVTERETSDLGYIQCESKNPPAVFWQLYPSSWEFLINFYTHVLHVPFYTRRQIFIQLCPTLTKLCHTKRDHPANFLHFTRTLTSKHAYWSNDVMSYPTWLFTL